MGWFERSQRASGPSHDAVSEQSLSGARTSCWKMAPSQWPLPLPFLRSAAASHAASAGCRCAMLANSSPRILTCSLSGKEGSAQAHQRRDLNVHGAGPDCASHSHRLLRAHGSAPASAETRGSAPVATPRSSRCRLSWQRYAAHMSAGKGIQQQRRHVSALSSAGAEVLHARRA
jgi:hypothetical protein